MSILYCEQLETGHHFAASRVMVHGEREEDHAEVTTAAEYRAFEERFGEITATQIIEAGERLEAEPEDGIHAGYIE